MQTKVDEREKGVGRTAKEPFFHCQVIINGRTETIETGLLLDPNSLLIRKNPSTTLLSPDTQPVRAASTVTYGHLR